MLEQFTDVGIDLKAAMEEMWARFRQRRARQPNTFRACLTPNLQRIGLITERTAPQYREFGMEIEV